MEVAADELEPSWDGKRQRSGARQQKPQDPPSQRLGTKLSRLQMVMPLVFALLVSRSSAQPTFRFGSISWAACDTLFADPYFPHVCRTAKAHILKSTLKWLSTVNLLGH
jgi:hypothetical protein